MALLSIACESRPSARSDAPSATGTASSPATATAAGSSTAAPKNCPALRKTVVAEAKKLSTCKANADCKVHRIVLCDFDELDCYAAHVNKAGSTSDLDTAIGAYSKSCAMTKCRCGIPSKSICRDGKCASDKAAQ